MEGVKLEKCNGRKAPDLRAYNGLGVGVPAALA
jgi:hypothetical protein